MFYERYAVGPQKCFTPSDLLQYMESLLKESTRAQMRSSDKSNYSWLKSRSIEGTNRYDHELEQFKPIVFKMSPELCTVAAVQLERLVDEAKSPREVVAAIKSVVEERQTAQLLEGVARRAKEKSTRKRNTVHPELTPPGRQPTVSFVLD